MKSEQINELAAALAQAQNCMTPAKKDQTNPHLKNTYATLDSIIEAARQPLSTNGLSFVQILEQSETGPRLETWLLHSSGQWIQGKIEIKAGAGNRGINEIQALGSALTYYKRYALAAMLGISVADEDDDGNLAIDLEQKSKQQKTSKQQPKPAQSTAPGFPTIVEEVNQELGKEHYNVYHASQVCKKVLPDFKVPGPDDIEALAGAKQVLLDHANAPDK